MCSNMLPSLVGVIVDKFCRICINCIDNENAVIMNLV